MGTDAVPDDGRFHVLVDGVSVLSTASKAKALSKYREIREQLGEGRDVGQRPDPGELLRRLKADAEITAVLAASSRAKRANATLRRGGVGRWKST
jgi:hypothetical protein